MLNQVSPSNDAWTLPTNIRADSPDDIILVRAMRLASTVVRLWHEEAADTCPSRHLIKALDDFLRDAIEHFHDSCPCRKDIDLVFQNTRRCSDYEFLRSLDKGAVPIALVRAIMHRDEVWFDPHEVPAWKAFAVHYGEVLLASDDALH